MGVGHDHGAHHHHAPTDFTGAFAFGIILNTIFVIIEAGYGFASGSMALLADAGHNLSDVLGLIIAWIGAILVKRRPSPRFSYGLKKSSILAALFNALFLLIAVGAIGAEAIRRLADPEPANGETMMIVAGIGILINGATAMLFARGSKDDINIRGAFLHMAADAAVSAGVVIAGYLVLVTGKSWIDPAVSLVIGAVILWGTWNLLVESATMTLAGVPKGIDTSQVEHALAQLPGVHDTHHLHIWSLSTTETALTVHLVVEPGANRDRLLGQANAYVKQMFGISHSTIQVEEDCETPHCHEEGHDHNHDQDNRGAGHAHGHSH
nr:cation diffusion facilitator family transporter [uncultured Sphingomonas sp.]